MNWLVEALPPDGCHQVVAAGHHQQRVSAGLTAVLIAPLAMKFGAAARPGFSVVNTAPVAAVGVTNWPDGSGN